MAIGDANRNGAAIRRLRQRGPFVPVECSAMPGTLIESELFGYERGAFTGAAAARVGLAEAATGGTLLIDEVGELPLELQPKLLRLLEKREVRRLGSNTPTTVDARIIAATHRSLRSMVKAGKFREDLYFRLSALKLRLVDRRACGDSRGEQYVHLCQVQQYLWTGIVYGFLHKHPQRMRRRIAERKAVRQFQYGQPNVFPRVL